MTLRRALLAVAAAVACGRPEPPAALYQDLIVEGRLASSRGAVAPDEFFCADELRFGLKLADGEELTAAVAVAPGGHLLLAACVSRPKGEGKERGDRLELEIVPARGGPPAAQRLPLPRVTRAFGAEVDLAGLTPGPARLRLRARVPSGRVLVLRDLVVRAPAAPAPAGRQPPRQVLLISVDTLRGDALGALGGPWPTPRLDRFAAGAEVFAQHHAAASWTKPSHASLLTGHSPPVHGAGEDTASPIHPRLPLLAERFREAGFATKGLVTECVWLRPGYGFGRGFDEYESQPWSPQQLTRQAANWVAAHRRDDFFLFLHLFDTHSDFWHLPYESPGVQRRLIEERFGGGYGCRSGLCASHLLQAIQAGEVEPLPREAEVLSLLYGGGVRHLDAVLGELLADLEALGMLEGLLVVLTSDHGEALLEQGRVLHGTAWTEVLRVPLVVRWPAGARAGQRRLEPTSALDLAPTLLAAFGLPTGDLPGSDLRAARRARPVFAWGGWRAIVEGSLKAVLPPGEAEALLFDLAVDPGEARDLARERPADLARLVALMRAREREDATVRARLGAAAHPPVPVSEEDRARLRALGYLP